MLNRLSLVILLSLALFHLGAAQQACTLQTLPDGTTADSCPYLHTCQDNVCVRQPLFPLAPIEIAGTVIVVLITGLATAGGLSGGILLAPVLMIFYRYSEPHSIFIVYAMIFGGSIGSILTTGRKRHPKTNKPFLNLNLSLICNPPMLAGTAVGIIINRLMATAYDIVGMVLLITYSFTRIYIRARTAYKKETATKAEEAKSVSSLDTLMSDNNLENSEYDPVIDSKLQKILADENKVYPLKKLLCNVAILSFMIIMVLIRGTSSFKSLVGISYCGEEYWLLFIATIVGCIIFGFFFVRDVKAELRIKKEAGYVESEHAFVIREKKIPKLLLLSIIAGLLAGMFGIGFAMFMGPSLLKMGLEPQALSAIAGFFHFQTALMSLITALLFNEIPISTYGFFMLLTFVGSFGLTAILNHLVKKYQRPSILLFILLFILGLAWVSLPTFEILNNIHDLSALLKFQKLC